jgi:DNA gyrase/topoisomerase IV subunit B
MFGEEYELCECNDCFFAVFPNPEDEFRHFSYVNGLNLPSGGTHIDLVSMILTNRVRDVLVKKYKTIKPADIKNKFLIVFLGKNFRNFRPDSQTKEKLTNSTQEVTEYLGQIDWENFAKKVLKNKAIIDPITEVYKLKEELKKRQELKDLTKTVKEVFSEKYYPSIGTKKYLMIVEGDSAFGGLSPALGRKECGYFTLKGKPLNAYSSSQSKFTQNIELSDLYKVVKNEGYEYLIYATDQDLDGFHIRGLLSGFIHRYLPECKDKIGILQTPVIAIKKNNKLTKWFYSLNDEIKVSNGETSKYYKGLGSWKTKDLQFVIEKDGLENMIDFMEFDNEELLDDWLSDSKSDKRKEYISQNEFSIAKA